MSFVQDRMKAPGVPFLVTLYLFVVIGFGVVLGIPALFGNGLLDTHTVGWGGREFGIAIGAIIAFLLRSPIAYFLIFVIGLFRELSDVLEALDETPSNTASAIQVTIFIIIGAVCAWFSYRAMQSEEEIAPVRT